MLRLEASEELDVPSRTARDLFVQRFPLDLLDQHRGRGLADGTAFSLEMDRRDSIARRLVEYWLDQGWEHR